MNDNVVLTSGKDIGSNRLSQGKRRGITRIITVSAVAFVAGAGILAVVLALAGLLVLGSLPRAAAAAPVGGVFQSPTSIDSGHYLASVSCPTTSFCMAVDYSGHALSWDGSGWSSTPSTGDNNALYSVSCPSPTFCMAVGYSGNALTWGGSGWSSVTSTGDSHALTSVSCPTTTFCMAVDNYGNALSWDGSSWTTYTGIDGNLELASVSCPTTTFCMAVDDSGNALSWDGGSTWTTYAGIDSGNYLASVSCPTTSFCMAVGHNSSTNVGVALSWDGSGWSTATDIDSGHVLKSVSCPTTTFCMAVDNYGNALTWDGSGWSNVTDIDGSNLLTSVSCPTTSFCMAVDASGYALSWDGSGWSSVTDIDGSNLLTSVSCPSPSFCMAVDGSGNALTWGGSSWSSATSTGDSNVLRSVSCPTTTFCMAVDDGGNALSWDGNTWSSATDIDGSNALYSVSCPTTTFCMAVSYNSSTDVGVALSWDGSTNTWSSATSIDSGNVLTSVSCPSPSFCMAVDGSGNAFSWDGGSTWTTYTSIDGTLPLSSVSCPTTTFCMAVDWGGHALSWDGNTNTWSSATSIDSGYVLTSVSCPTTTFCMAVDAAGHALTWNGSSWSSVTSTGDSNTLNSVSCPSPSFCMAVDAAGHALSWAPPTAPTSTTATFSSPGNSATVSWKAPSDSEGPAPASYDLVITDETAGTSTAVPALSSSETSYSATGLVAGNVYRFSVAAVTSGGLVSAPSESTLPVSAVCRWNGGGGSLNDTVASAANWMTVSPVSSPSACGGVGNTTSGPPSDAQLVFPAGPTQQSVSVSTSSTSYDSLVFEGGSYTISGSSTLTLGASLTPPVAILDESLGTTTISVPISSSGTTTVSSGTLVIASSTSLPGGAVTLGSSTTLDLAPAGTMTVSNAISGAGSLISDPGSNNTLTLSGSNTYTGSTTVTSGTLTAAGSGDALGTGAVTVIGSATLNLDPSSAHAYDNALVLGGGSGGSDTLEDQSPTNADSWTGGVTLTTNSIGVINGAGSSGSFVVSGVIGNSGIGALRTEGLVTLSGSNTYTGTTTVSTGTLKDRVANALPTGTTLDVVSGATFDLNGNNQQVGGFGTGTGTITNGSSAVSSATLTYGGSASSTFSGSLTNGTHPLSLDMDGTGTLTLSGTTNTYTGTTTVSSGTLEDGVADALPTSTTLNVASGATFDLNGNNQTVASLGSSSGTITNGGSSGAVLTDGESGSSTFSGSLTNSTTTYPLSLDMDGTGTLTLSGTNTYSGTTTVSSGTLEDGVANALPTGTTLDVVFGATFDLNGNNQQVGGFGTGAGTITNGSSATSSATLTYGGSSNPTFSGSLTNGTHPLSLDMDGTGTLTLSGTNSYTGATTVGSGTLVAGSASALGATTSTPGSGGLVTVAGGATLQVGSMTSTSLSLPNDLVLSGGATLASSARSPSSNTDFYVEGSVTLDGQADVYAGFSSNLYLDGQVTGSGGITTTGQYTTWVTGLSNDYSGGTTVGNSGTLVVEASGGLGTGLVTDEGNAPIIMSGSISLPNDMALAGLNYCGGIVCDGSSAFTPSIPAGNDSLSGNITLYGDTTVAGGHSSVLQLSGDVSGGYGLTTIGTVGLSGTNSYSGTTTVGSGTLVAGSASALGATISTPGSGGLVSVSAGATLQLASGSSACLPSGLSPANFTLPNDVSLYADGASGSEGLDACSGSNAISGSVSLHTSSTHTTVAMDVNTGATLTLSGNVSGSGQFQLGNGAGGVDGTLVLSGTNGYTGSITVAEGTLEVTGSIASSSGVTVEGGTTLEGTGTVPAITTSGCSSSSPCTIYPGDAPGTLTSTGYANLSAAGSTLEVALAGTSAGSYSQLVADGAKVTGTSLDVTSVTPAAYGTVFDILHNTSGSPVTGEFSYEGSSVTQGEVLSIDGRKYQASYTGGTGNDFTLTDVTNPPPPAPAPVITSISPTSGPIAGGTTVTIDGSNLFGAAYVFFGNTQAVSFSIVSSTEIQATSPAESAGTVNVTVTTPGGTSATSSADQFTYQASTPPKPTVTSITPTSGSTTGGTSVTITGTNFTSGTTVMFGTVAATAVTVSSATSITATSPAESAGTVNVTVTTAGGTSATSSADQFTYQTSTPSKPTVTSITPTSGPTTGGTSVTITGTGFTSGATVDFGSTAATSVTYTSTTSLTAISPAKSAGTVNVTVTTPGGTSAIGSADQFTYVVVPTVTAISPTSGPASGGTSVTITGTNFTSSATVMFGTITATAVTYNSPTSITAISPAESAGTVNVTVTTTGGTSSTSSTDQFTYLTPISGDAYTPINPQRLADTRCSAVPQPSYCSSENLPTANASLGTLAAGKSENVVVTGVDAIPLTATAVVVNMTAVNMTGGGYLSIYPEGSTPAVVSSLNWTSTSRVVTNLVTVPVNTSNGEISVSNGGTSGTVDYVVDIEGYYAPPGSTPVGLYNPVTPSRLVDTRCSETSPPVGITSSYCASLPSANAKLATLGRGQIENVTVTGVGGIPSSGVSAVVLNLTAIGPTSSGYLSAFPTGATKAEVSTVNFNKGETTPNRVIVKVGSNGQISIYNNSGNTNFAVDVSGYYTDGSSSTQSGSLFNPVTPARILDTRCSQSPQPSPCSSENLPTANATLSAIPGGNSITIQVTGEANIPADATAVVGNLTAVDSTGGGYLTVYSSGTAPTTSDVNFGIGITDANMVIGGLTSSGTVNIANGGGHRVDVLFDASGWFTAKTS